MDHRYLKSSPARSVTASCITVRISKKLICKLDSLAFPLRDGIPVLLETEARPLALEESHS
ncbi:protein YcaR in KDO2-Lipid A biosynthesis cluster [Klebsiella pneumoniae subsp. pneumoniae]|nr:protein YcaR in KDO2-Lipid A biosynthesis cluster [Klebsiella pneumoniae subsp. pneumoniae]